MERWFRDLRFGEPGVGWGAAQPGDMGDKTCGGRRYGRAVGGLGRFRRLAVESRLYSIPLLVLD